MSRLLEFISWGDLMVKLIIKNMCFYKYWKRLLLNPICVCGLEIETTTHFLLHCPLFQCAIQSLLTNIKKIDDRILKKHDELITKTILYGDNKFDLSCNKSKISSTIELILSTERFTNSLV